MSVPIQDIATHVPNLLLRRLAAERPFRQARTRVDRRRRPLLRYLGVSLRWPSGWPGADRQARRSSAKSSTPTSDASSP